MSSKQYFVTLWFCSYLEAISVSVSLVLVCVVPPIVAPMVPPEPTSEVVPLPRAPIVPAWVGNYYVTSVGMNRASAAA